MLQKIHVSVADSWEGIAPGEDLHNTFGILKLLGCLLVAIKKEIIKIIQGAHWSCLSSNFSGQVQTSVWVWINDYKHFQLVLG